MPSLPTRTIANTKAEHVSDHNALKDFYNDTGGDPAQIARRDVDNTFAGAAKFKGHPWHDVQTEAGVDPTGVSPSQSGLQTVLNTSKRVYFSAGSYHLTAGLTVPADRIIEFAPDAEITVPAGGTFDVLVIDGVTDVTVKRPRIRKLAGGAYAGNKSGVAIIGNAADVTIEDGDVDGLGRAYHVGGVAGVGIARRVTLRDCIGRNSVQFNLDLEDCDVVTADNFRSIGSGNDGVKMRGTADNVTMSFYATGAGDNGFDAFGGGRKFEVPWAVCESNTGGGFVVKSSTANATKAFTIEADDDRLTMAGTAFTVTAADDIFTSTAHGLIVGEKAVLVGLTGGAGLTADTAYWVRDVTTNTFKLSATLGGAAIDVTSDGSGTVVRPHNHASADPVVLSSLVGGAGLVAGTTYYVRENTPATLKLAATSGGAAIDITSDGTANLKRFDHELIRSALIGTVACRNNGGYGFSISRHSADSGDNAGEPLPAHITVGQVISEENGGYGAYFRGQGILVGQVIANGNGLHGIEVDRSCIDLTIESWYAAGNGTDNDNTYDGLHVEGGIRLRFGPGHALGAWVPSARSEADLAAGTPFQRWGCRIEAETTSYTVVAPDGAYNMTGLFSDLSHVGWVMPSTGFPTMIIPNAQFIQGYQVDGTARNILRLNANDIIEIGNTATTQVTCRAATKWLISPELELDGPLNHDGATIGFYGTTPIAKQAGVAVTAAGIHAALVALGLISA